MDSPRQTGACLLRGPWLFAVHERTASLRRNRVRVYSPRKLMSEHATESGDADRFVCSNLEWRLAHHAGPQAMSADIQPMEPKERKPTPISARLIDMPHLSRVRNGNYAHGKRISCFTL
jgi:hypothetical protein